MVQADLFLNTALIVTAQFIEFIFVVVVPDMVAMKYQPTPTPVCPDHPPMLLMSPYSPVGEQHYSWLKHMFTCTRAYTHYTSNTTHNTISVHLETICSHAFCFCCRETRSMQPQPQTLQISVTTG